MQLPSLLQGLTGASPQGGVNGLEQQGVGQSAEQKQAERLTSSAKILNNPVDAGPEKGEIDYRFRLNPALYNALDKAVSYMNRVLEPDGLQMEVHKNEDETHIAAVVKDLNNNENIIKEYSPHDVLRYYADSGYGTGVVVDGRI